MAQTKKEKEPPKLSDCTPAEYLKMHGHEVDRVWRVWSAGDSDFGHETLLFSTPAGIVRTAVVVRGEVLVVRDGWDYFYVECY